MDHYCRGRNLISSSKDFAAFYEDHSRNLLIFFAQRTYEPEIAVDLTAETFAQALIARNSFRGSSREEAGGWLYGIARNQLSNFMRKGVAERKALERLGLERPQLNEEEHERVVELVDMEPAREAVRDGLAGMTDEHREILELRVVEQLGYREVAQRLDITEEAARARASRGLRDLAKRLDLEAIAIGGKT